ncbi:tetratricopeptide repeat protein [Nonomuraea roseola]|uniref:Tetratricopeptide repeat protein n=1 Tax=Nonomuraea roseola TaxID=46179 RepID=A0ABV5Q6K9_9ACTN
MTTPYGDGVVQNVSVNAGVAYGVIGADLHVFGDGSPLYLLENWRGPVPVDSGTLRDQPSRMLNARHAVVEFTGREAEMAQLRGWRDSTPRLGVRWLHGPGGQGKSRLAAQVAEESLAQGWKVISAVHGPGTVLPADRREDLRLTGAAGLLVIVDYADQWPLTHLTWLFSNALLYQVGVPTRILLVARTLDAWPGVRATLADRLASTSAQALSALDAVTAERQDMFLAARDSFARHYDLADPEAIAAPSGLDGQDLGLTLGVHMAALVAVDAYATGVRRPPPADMAALAAYLLDREHLHWARLHSEETHRIDPAGRTFTTTPAAMNYAVFIASLTGAVAHDAGRSLLGGAPVDLDEDRTLADHAVCYPPLHPAATSVLEPLYPDRLAEDFLALTITGHPVDYPAQPWAAPTAAAVLRRPAVDHTQAWTPRAVTFLASAAGRWAHVGPRCLFPLLRDDPQLAYDAGSAALVALATAVDVDSDLLESLADLLPDDQHVDLDVGAAAVAQRVITGRLATTDDLEERADLLAELGKRLSYAGRSEDALEPTRAALTIRRQLAADGSYGHQSDVAASLNVLGILQSALGLHEEALATTLEAMEIHRELAEPSYMIAMGAVHLPALATTLHNAARLCELLGDPYQALRHAQESVSIDAQLAREHPAHLSEFAESLAMVGAILSNLGRESEALFAEEQAAQILTALADVDPAAHLPELADVLNNMGITLSKLGRPADAVTPMIRAVELERRLAKANPDAYLPGLAQALNNLSTRYAELGDFLEALPVAEESVGIYTRLAAANPVAHAEGLARALHNLSSGQMTKGMLCREPELLRVGIETEQRALRLQRDLAASNPAAHIKDLAGYLMAFGFKLSKAERHLEGLAPTEEAVMIFRRLAGDDPVAHRPSLALGLTGFATVRASGGVDLDRAHAAFQEAFDIYRELEETTPGVHLANLASALLNFVTTRATSGATPDAALEAVEEAVSIYEHILEAMPDNRLQALGLWGTYHLWAELLDEVGRGEEAADLRGQLAEHQREAERGVGA